MRAATLAELSDRLGSVNEARWILDQGGDRWPELVERRLAGEPLQYVLGSWAFRQLELLVDPRVLIPRPETEAVVGVALTELDRRWPRGTGGGRGGRGPWCVDLGTGSGAIALSLATEARPGRPGLDVWATDRSADSLAVAGENLARVAAAQLGAAPVSLSEGDWYDALPVELCGRIDLLVSNPPYVAEAEVADLDPVVRDWEPSEALVAGPGRSGVPGMAAVDAVVDGAPEWLGPDGVLVVELDPRQARAATEAARSSGFADIRVEPDLAGRDRVLVARR